MKELFCGLVDAVIHTSAKNLVGLSIGDHVVASDGNHRFEGKVIGLALSDRDEDLGKITIRLGGHRAERKTLRSWAGNPEIKAFSQTQIANKTRT